MNEENSFDDTLLIFNELFSSVDIYIINEYTKKDDKIITLLTDIKYFYSKFYILPKFENCYTEEKARNYLDNYINMNNINSYICINFPEKNNITINFLSIYITGIFDEAFALCRRSKNIIGYYRYTEYKNRLTDILKNLEYIITKDFIYLNEIIYFISSNWIFHEYPKSIFSNIPINNNYINNDYIDTRGIDPVNNISNRIIKPDYWCTVDDPLY